MMENVHSELVSEGEWDALAENLRLSPRQAQIVGHILHGKSDKQIAHDLHISVPTVRTYMTRMFQKFEVNDRVELLVCVVRFLREYWRSGTSADPMD
ncbi:MAG: response regulator transcription factor [Candidatus Eiseniibacteriota bacterium]|nr:MAG: response regulator transcription factor [Candidatus Eisenbacteria bacterium]